MSSTPDKEKRDIYLAFDTESTGDGDNDIPFAAGFSYTLDYNLYKVMFSMDLGKNEDESWEDLWKRRGFSMKCWNEFWSENQHKLDELMKRATSKTSEELAHKIETKLISIEKRHNIKRIVTNTNASDGWRINNILVQSGNFQPLHYDRSGENFNAGIQYTTYIQGSLLLLPHEKRTEPEMELIDEMVPEIPEQRHNHLADDDAAYHAIKLERTIAFVKELRKELINFYIHHPDKDTFPLVKKYIQHLQKLKQ